MTVPERIRNVLKAFPHGLTSDQLARVMGRTPTAIRAALPKAKYIGLVEIARQGVMTNGRRFNVYVAGQEAEPIRRRPR